MKRVTRYAMWVLWPSFLAAGVGVGIIFSLVDPAELVVLGHAVHASRVAVYTAGFFVLWFICALASALSCFLQAGARDGVGTPPGATQNDLEI